MADERPNSTNGTAATPPLHVLHVADFDIFDRFGRMLRHIALAQNAEGLRVSLLTDDPVAVADLEGTPVECHWLPVLSGWRAWRPVRQFTRQLDPRPDVIHMWGTAYLGLVGNWALHAGVAVVVHVLSTGDVAQVLKGRWREHARIAAGCAGLREMLREHSAGHLEPAGGYSPAFLTPEPQPERTIGDEHTLGVIWAGRCTEDAGLDMLLDAVARLHEKECDVQVVLVGAGPEAGALRGRIRAAQVQGYVSLVEEPDLWDQAMGGADVCVVPARQDELFLAPLLAMAMKKVVVASRDQIAEWFIEDVTAWQFTPGEAVELAYHLSRVAENDRHAQELRESAAAYVREHHAISRLVGDLLAAYRDAHAARSGS